MEGKGLGEDSFKGTAVRRHFESNFAGMKSKRETKGELKSLDAQLESRQRRGRLRRRSRIQS